MEILTDICHILEGSSLNTAFTAMRACVAFVWFWCWNAYFSFIPFTFDTDRVFGYRSEQLQWPPLKESRNVYKIKIIYRISFHLPQ
jgi:hypothetical protein